MKNYLEIQDNELNSLSYYSATTKDKRTFFQTYISFLKTRQILLFTFKCKNDYYSKIMKFCFFFFIFALFFFVNTLFLTENSLHIIDISGGHLGIINSFSSIFPTIIITSFIKNILLEFMFTEDNVFYFEAKSFEEKESWIGAVGKAMVKTTNSNVFMGNY